jgi:hypothetical protein
MFLHKYVRPSASKRSNILMELEINVAFREEENETMRYMLLAVRRKRGAPIKEVEDG